MAKPKRQKATDGTTAGRNARLARRRQLHVEAVERRLLLATYTVKNYNDAGPDSLRDAIAKVNLDATADTINFSIPAATPVAPILLATNLPTLTNAVTIDAGTTPVSLGLAASSTADHGLSFAAGSDSSTVTAAAGNPIAFAGFATGVEVAAPGISLAHLSFNTPGSGTGVLLDAAATGASVAGATMIGGSYGIHVAGAKNATLSAPNVTATTVAAVEIDGATATGDTLSGGTLHANAQAGVAIGGGAAGNTVTGTSILGNSGYGVQIGNSGTNTIGPLDIIAGNGLGGVGILGTSAGNKVVGDFIGTHDAAATVADGNFGPGVDVLATGGGNVVGQAGAGNTIADNAGPGVSYKGDVGTGNAVVANTILANGTGGGLDGILVSGGVAHVDVTNNTITGNGKAGGAGVGVRYQSLAPAAGAVTTGTVAGNTITANAAGGIALAGPGVVGVVVVGNTITADGGPGVVVGVGVSATVVGDSAPLTGGAGLANTITGNATAGVAFVATAGTGNVVLSNSISGNPTPGPSVGIANSPSAPVLTAAVNFNDALQISGTIGIAPGTYLLQVFDDGAANSPDGKTLLGSAAVTTDAAGAFGPTSIPIAASSQLSGHYIAASATPIDATGHAAGNTSSFTATPVQAVDALIVTNVNDSGAGSLRAAVQAADDHPNAPGKVDTITFRFVIPPVGGFYTINLATALPTITEAALVDGTSALADDGTTPARVVVSNGATEAIIDDGFHVLKDATHDGSGTTIRGLAIAGFASAGVDLDGTTGNVLANLTITAGSAGSGVLVRNVVGPATSSLNADTIAGGSYGVRLSGGSPRVVGTGTTISGATIAGVDYSGTDNAGLAGVAITAANTAIGVFFEASAARSTFSASTVSGGLYGVDFQGDHDTAGPGVSITGASAAGVLFQGSADTLTGSTVQGTTAGPGVRISATGGGETVAASTIKGNAGAGVLIQQSPGNFIGAAGAGDTIIGNGGDGVTIDGDPTEADTIAGALGNDVVFDTITGNAGFGIQVNDASSTLIDSDTIGTNAAGGVALVQNPNFVAVSNLVSNNAIQLNGQAGNTLLGSTTVGDAVLILRSTQDVIRGNTIVGNAAAGGTIPGYGIRVQGSVLADPAPTNNTIDANSIAANTAGGVALVGGTNKTTLTGNAITGNQVVGVVVGEAAEAAPGNAIGAPFVVGGPAPRNVISGTAGPGIDLLTPALVEGNVVGAAATPNTGDGILVEVDGVTVGGTDLLNPDGTLATQLGNVVSGNLGDGIHLTPAATNATIRGNYVGLAADGKSAIANGLDGILVAADHAAIGGANTLNPDGTIAARAGNVVSGNAGIGILIASTGTAASVLGNEVGTDPAGLAALPNRGGGIEVAADGTTIGGTAAPGDRNVISGNATFGVHLAAGATGATVQGNYVGTDVTGTKAVTSPAAGVGILVDVAGATIGGTNLLNPDSTIATRVGNLVSGNAGDGIHIDPTATGVTLQGNFVGTDLTGTKAVANLADGILDAADGATLGIAYAVGTPAEGLRNLVSGNTRSGIELAAGATNTTLQGDYVGTDYTGTKALGNGTGILDGASNATIGGANTLNPDGTIATRFGNVVSGNAVDGIAVASGSANVSIYGNYVGTDPTGLLAVSPTAGVNGIHVSGPGATVGAADAAHRNVISGNFADGLRLDGPGALAVGNFIGTDRTGLAILANGGNGVVVAGTGNTVSGDLVSGNALDGIRIIGGSTNIVAGNRIGTDATGVKVLPDAKNTPSGNGGAGVHLINATANTVGTGNTISGNRGDGVLIDGTSTANHVSGNFVGTDAAGLLILPNALSGVHIAGASGNFVDGNTISANALDGVLLDAGASSNLVDGKNTITLNRRHGVHIDGASSTLNTIDANLITDNLADGVLINASTLATAAPNNTLSNNTIVRNHADGVALTGTNKNRVVGNKVGLDASGVIAGNLGFGVRIDAAAVANTVGAGNTISGNTLGGVLITGLSVGNTVSGDRVGTTLDGLAILPDAQNQPFGNGGVGVHIKDSSINTIGLGNTISGNRAEGVLIDGTSAGNDLSGNKIGTTTDGLAALPNALSGLHIDGPGATGNIVATGNVISGNALDGVLITGTASSAGNLVGGNLIGTDATELKALGNGGSGVHINSASGNTVGTGNIISGNAGDGILIEGNSTGNHVSGNRIGTDFGGTSALPNALSGVHIDGPAAAGNFIDAGNVISGNTLDGVLITATVATSANTVSGNFIGTDATGLAVLPDARNAPFGNGGAGVHIMGASGNTVGTGNTISGNRGDGVLIDGISTGNHVSANRIGTDFTGLVALPNAINGVRLTGSATDNRVDLANTISGNTLDGILIDSSVFGNVVAGNLIGTDATGKKALPNAMNGVELLGANANSIGVGIGNTISGNARDGILVDGGSKFNLILGNRIGTDITGLVALPNGMNGVHLTGPGAIRNRIEYGNTISGNARDGILIDPSDSANFVEGNLIGTDVTGKKALPNAMNGVHISGANDSPNINIIDGGNTISGNALDGILLDAGSNFDQITANRIGTDITGLVALGNGRSGVHLSGAGVANNDIESNLISGNLEPNVRIDSGAFANVVDGNLIGPDSSGKQALPSPIAGLLEVGVLIENATGNVVGNQLDAAGHRVGNGNTIAGNPGDGIIIRGMSTGNYVSGNRIGVGVDGSALPNVGDGVHLDGPGVKANFVDGGNTIGGNRAGGVLIMGGASGNTVAGNFIGTDATGKLSLGNTGDGVAIADSPGNFVDLNAIEHNDRGIRITGAASTGNAVTRNLVALNQIGVEISGAGAGNIVGAYVADPSAVSNGIVANLRENVLIEQTAGTILAGNRIENSGESVGVHLIGTIGDVIYHDRIVDNVGGGILIGQSTGVTAFDNTIAGNLGDGVRDDQGRGNRIIHNTITGNGLDASGKFYAGAFGVAVVNTVPNAPNVVTHDTIAENTITGNATGGVGLLPGTSNTLVTDNVVASNRTFGIIVAGTSNLVSANTVESNKGVNAGSGIVVTGGAGNAILDNVVGLAKLGNVGPGIRVQYAAGTTVQGNHVEANTEAGIDLVGASATAVVGNTVVGNLYGGIAVRLGSIGNDLEGNHVLDNLGAGVEIDAAQTILGAIAATPNVIMGNGVGIHLGGARGSMVLEGDLVINNKGVGVVVDGASGGNLFRGGKVDGNGSLGVLFSSSAGGNTLSGVEVGYNRGAGVGLDGAGGNTVTGSNVLGNLGGGVVMLGGTAGNHLTGNRVTGNALFGLLIAGASSNLDTTGNTITANQGDGVTIAGLSAGNSLVDNVIGDNRGSGVRIDGPSATGNSLAGNLIGLAADGQTRLGNGVFGVYLRNTSGNLVGDPTTGSAAGVVSATHNTIAGNGADDVRIGGGGGNYLENNFLGTSSAGAPLGGPAAAVEGLTIRYSPNNLVAHNLISGHGSPTARQAGVLIDDDNLANTADATPGHLVVGTQHFATGNVLSLNLIGTGPGGQGTVATTSAQGGLQNTQGVVISGASSNTLDGNVIGGNAEVGVHIFNAALDQRDGQTITTAATTGNVLTNNTIGQLGSKGAPNAVGVFLDDADGNVVGTPGNGNTITGNTAHGVVLLGGVANSVVRYNTIAGPGAGIFLDGVASSANFQGVVAGSNVNGDTPIRQAKAGPFVDSSRLTVDASGTSVLITFGQYVDRTPGGPLLRDSTYRLQRVAGPGAPGGASIPFHVAGYDEETRTVRLQVDAPGLDLTTQQFKLTIPGGTAGGTIIGRPTVDARGGVVRGRALDGNFDSLPGGPYQAFSQPGARLADGSFALNPVVAGLPTPARGRVKAKSIAGPSPAHAHLTDAAIESGLGPIGRPDRTAKRGTLNTLPR